MERLISEMKVRIVEFRFRKVDGTIRIARGTLKSEMLPLIKGTGKPLHDSLQLYYDVDKQSWRSFKKENLIDYKLAK